MNQPPMSEDEQADLVAYLDGELSGEAARAMEAKLALDGNVRAEADSLKRTWDLLDFLPKAEPSPNFTANTVSRIEPIPRVKQSSSALPALKERKRRPLWRVLAAACWAMALVGGAVGGYWGYRGVAARGPGDRELVRDLRVIEYKRFYDAADDLEFIRKLDSPELFGD